MQYYQCRVRHTDATLTLWRGLEVPLLTVLTVRRTGYIRFFHQERYATGGRGRETRLS